VGNYTEIYQHFVWATKRRAPYIVPEVEPLLHDYIRTKCTELKVIVHAVNSMPDHLHLACSLPMTITPSFFLEQIKGGSAHFINHHPRLRSKMEICLYWQSGCGLLTSPNANCRALFPMWTIKNSTMPPRRFSRKWSGAMMGTATPTKKRPGPEGAGNRGRT
jgi:REP element-mobilizing transposase RayT